MRHGIAGRATEKPESKIFDAPMRHEIAGGATKKPESKISDAPMRHEIAGGATENTESKISDAPLENGLLNYYLYSGHRGQHFSYGFIQAGPLSGHTIYPYGKRDVLV